MGYSKVSYDDLVEHPEVWRSEKGLTSPAWAKEISELGYNGVWAVDFYADVFGAHLEPSRMPEDYQTGDSEGRPIHLSKRQGRRCIRQESHADGKPSTWT